MKNFDRIVGEYAYKELPIYGENNLIIGYKIDRYKLNTNNIFVFDRNEKTVYFDV